MSGSRNKAWLAGGLAALFFAVMTPWVLRPWFLSADDLPRDTSFFASVENADLLLNAWILAWVARASVTDPSALFDGNVFYPATNTIALSENMVAHVPITGPVFAATGSALAVLKAMALETFLLAGLGMFALVYSHTRNAGAALVAGAAFTFAPWRVQGFPHPQYLATGTIPLALLAIDLWIDRRRFRHLAGLAAAVAYQILACLYLGYFIAFGAGAYALARVAATRRAPLRALVGLIVAMGLGAAVAAPIGLPYLRARSDGIIPPFDPSKFLPHAWAPWDYVSAAFVGLAGVAVLALVAGDLGERAVRRLRRDPIGFTPREWALWAVVGVAVVFSTGPYVEIGDHTLPTPYLLFYDHLPGFSAIRGPRRFFIVVLAGLAALAGHAFARWTRRAPGWFQIGGGIVVALACAVAAAPTGAPVLSGRLGANAAPVYRWLEARPGGGAVLEIPTTSIEGDFVGAERNARYMLSSTEHWKPLVNGYSGYEPPTTTFLTTAIRELPRGPALQLLVDAVDVRWIIVHRDALIGPEKERWAQVDTPGLELVERFGTDDVYEVTRAPVAPWRERLATADGHPTGETWTGLSTAALAPECREGRILDVEAPPVVALTAFPIPIPVRFANDSPCAWPAVAIAPDGLVGLRYTWTNPAGETLPEGPLSRLLTDVPPRTSRTAPVYVIPPFGDAGTWQLEVRLVQVGEESPLAIARVPVEVKHMNTSVGL